MCYLQLVSSPVPQSDAPIPVCPAQLRGNQPAPMGGSQSMGHSPPSHSRSSTAASSKEQKPVCISKGLYFTGQSSSKLQQLQTVAPWEAALQPSRLQSGLPGYSSPNPLAKTSAQHSAGCRTPPQRSLRPRDTGPLHGALHRRCWHWGHRQCCRASHPCCCSAALHAPLPAGSSHGWDEMSGQRAPRATLCGLTFLAMLRPCTGSICTASSARLYRVPGSKLSDGTTIF